MPQQNGASYSSNEMEGRAPSRPEALGLTATTERGPPDDPKASAQKAHKLRDKGLMPLSKIAA